MGLLPSMILFLAMEEKRREGVKRKLWQNSSIQYKIILQQTVRHRSLSMFTLNLWNNFDAPDSRTIYSKHVHINVYKVLSK
jgi:hypothetical protein